MSDLNDFIEKVKSDNPHQPEFLQAVCSIAKDVWPLIEQSSTYKKMKVLERLSVPDRIIFFRVTWEDDNGDIQINRGWRVQQSNKLGPYKGGLRFHRDLTESTLKFLAFEQCFKNALTGMAIGGAKGGADFDPKGRSDGEIMRFCQAFMSELYRHIGANVDVPAGDINVGSREIGFLFGRYTQIANHFTGALTGKDLEFGGSHVRLEGTGYGLLYFLQAMLKESEQTLDGKKVAISGAGNVASYAAKKAVDMGAVVISLANSKGTLFKEEGLDLEEINAWIDFECDSDNPLKSFADQIGAHWEEDKSPWHLACDIALPCATQNELDKEDAERLSKNGCKWVAEGANMPCTDSAKEVFAAEDITFAPGKASNAGGVVMSAMEMTQNASFESLEFEKLNEKLQEIMGRIHQQCLDHAPKKKGVVRYNEGASRAAFKRLADAMVAQGIC